MKEKLKTFSSLSNDELSRSILLRLNLNMENIINPKKIPTGTEKNLF
jgi:hypothetical protein